MEKFDPYFLAFILHIPIGCQLSSCIKYKLNVSYSRHIEIGIKQILICWVVIMLVLPADLYILSEIWFLQREPKNELKWVKMC